MSMRNKLYDGAALGLWLALCFAVALFGAQFAPGEWYANLAKPAWTPPDWIFPPVWTLLYAMMGVAAWLIWRRRDRVDVRLALSLFIVQLAFNALWSWLFFGLHSIGLALVDIILLWLAISLTMLAFWRLRALAGVLLLPYWLWVGYALALNVALWLSNS